MNILEKPSPDELVFEMIGVDISFANALRRIMLAEVPSVAIEHVYSKLPNYPHVWYFCFTLLQIRLTLIPHLLLINT